MKTIWKQQLAITDTQIISVPGGSRFLTVQMQNGVPCIWYIVDTEESGRSQYEFTTVGTGNPIDELIGNYLGTYQKGPLVFHVFYRLN